jgi:hypothetical protein
VREKLVVVENEIHLKSFPKEKAPLRTLCKTISLLRIQMYLEVILLYVRAFLIDFVGICKDKYFNHLKDACTAF